MQDTFAQARNRPKGQSARDDRVSCIQNFMSFLYKKDYRRALALRNTFRLIDDISILNSDGVFQELAREIYPSSLILNKENINDNEADILDLNIFYKGW